MCRMVRLSSLLAVVLSAVFTPAQTVKHAAKGPDPDQSAIHDFILNMDMVNKYAAVSRKLRTAAGSDPMMTAEMKKIEAADIYNVEKAAMIEKSPRIAAFLKAYGISARDFVLIPMTVLTAGIATAAEDAKGKPPAFVNQANIQFVRDHRAELEKLELFGSDDSRDGDPDGKNSDNKDKN